VKNFIDKINYSSANEDGAAEARALEISKTDRILCITGSGARPLDLLTERPASMISLDVNPCQTFLLELKMQAMAEFDYERYVAFLGLVPADDRPTAYRAIRGGLTKEARSFWDGNPGMIRKGVLYQGGWEKYFRGLALAVGLTRNDLRDKLFSSPTVDRQARLWNEVWESRTWRAFLRAVTGRTVWRTTFGDPGFYEHVPAAFPATRYIEDKLRLSSKNILFSQSPYANLLFFGRYLKALPPHLRKENFEVIKNNLNRIQPITQSLGDYLKTCGTSSFDKFSLSDFSSYTDEREYARIWNGVLRAAAPGARICERQYLVKRALPYFAPGTISRDTGLEADLEMTDGSIFFSFIIARVARNGHV